MNMNLIDWKAQERTSHASMAMKQGNIPLIDLSASRNLNETDLGDQAQIASQASESSIRPVIVTANPQVALLLAVTRLDRSFDIEARHSISKPAPVAVAPRASLASRGSRVLGMLLTVLVAGLLSACSTPHLLRVEPTSAAYMPEKPETSARLNQRCPAAGTPAGSVMTRNGDGLVLESSEPRHGPGDELRIDIADGEDFSGAYSINLDGHLELPFAGAITARGLTNTELSKAIAARLVKEGLFKPGQVRVSVSSVKWAPAQIHVAGAVFQPGRAIINEVNREKMDPGTSESVGDAPTGRYLDAGLRGGAGVRPDADLSKVVVERGSRKFTVDMSGVITGDLVPDVPLMTGDRIFVPSTGCFQSALMRPSQVTPAGIRVFMSNLTQPAANNSASSVERYATNLPYGTRLLQGAISSNCVGGAITTNAARSVVLVSVNPFNGKTEVIERSVENLVSNPDRDEINPFLMPNDAIACYDSGVTNMREAARALIEILGPAGLLLGAL